MNNTISSPSDFYLDLAKSRSWVFFHKNLHTFGIMAMGAVALALLQVVLCFAFPEMQRMWIGYFSFVMNTILVVLGGLSLIGWAGLCFFKNVTIDFGGEKPQMLLDAGSVSVAPDTIIMSLSADESSESFKARMDAAFENEGTQKWVLVIAFRHHCFQVLMASDVGKEGVRFFLRTHGLENITPTMAQTGESMRAFKSETFGQYIDYCRLLADDFKTWAAHEKTERTNPFIGATEFLKSNAILPMAFLFAMLPGFAFGQKTKQVEQYLGDRAEMAVPSGKVVDYVFAKREISVRSQGGNYLETLKGVAFFQDESDAGKLLLIKVGGEKILPVNPKKMVETSNSAIEPGSLQPIPDGTPGESFLDRLPDSTELQAMKLAHLKDKALEWRSIRPVLDYYMWRFWGLMVILFGIGGAMWVLAKVSAKDSIKDLYGNAFIGNAITQMHIMTKTFLFCLMAVPTLVIIIDDSVRAYYTSVFGFWFVVKYAAVYWVWQWAFEKILPDSPGQRTASTGGYPTPGQRHLNG